MRRLILAACLVVPFAANAGELAYPITFSMQDMKPMESFLRLSQGYKVSGDLDIIALDKNCPANEHVLVFVDKPTAKFTVCMGNAKEGGQ